MPVDLVTQRNASLVPVLNLVLYLEVLNLVQLDIYLGIAAAHSLHDRVRILSLQRTSHVCDFRDLVPVLVHHRKNPYSCTCLAREVRARPTVVLVCIDLVSGYDSIILSSLRALRDNIYVLKHGWAITGR